MHGGAQRLQCRWGWAQSCKRVGWSGLRAGYMMPNSNTRHHRDLRLICSLCPPMWVLLCVIVPQSQNHVVVFLWDISGIVAMRKGKSTWHAGCESSFSGSELLQLTLLWAARHEANLVLERAGKPRKGQLVLWVMTQSTRDV